MALNTVKLNGGTTDNPVVLSARQINGLVALYNDSNVTKDCSGYVKAASGKLRVSEFNSIQSLGFTIVGTETIPDEFTLYAANSNVLYEGKSVQLYSTGIDIKSLHLEIVSHEIIITGGIIGEDVIKSRIHVSNTGLVTVDEAEENATWQDVITIQAYPTFDPSNKILINNPITIKGVAMSGISVVAANSILIGTKTNIEVSPIPEDNTKNNYRITLEARNGAIGNGVYMAPSSPGNDTIIAECFLFGSGVPAFHVEKSISVKHPTIICEIKDKDGEEVEGAYISVTDGTTGVITQLNNGETMTAVLNRTYNIEAFIPEGYTKAVVVENITPREVETVITAIYYPLQIGVMAVFEDGSYIPYDEWFDLENPLVNENGYNLFGAGFISEDGDHWIFLGDNKPDIAWGDIDAPLSNPGSKENAIKYSQKDTIQTNKYLINVMNAAGKTPNNSAVLACHTKHIIINQQEVEGFLPSVHQLLNLLNNLLKINTINQYCGNATFYINVNHIQSCNESNKQNNESFTYRIDTNSNNVSSGWSGRSASKSSTYFNNLIFFEL